MSDNTLDQAFPVHFEAHDGMTLRDYFAAKAMQSFTRAAPNGTAFGSAHPETNLQYATAAYAMADAMLKARQE